jgi:uncharacterized membrane protein YgaE (UPF0421/DUF939 family)
MSEASGAISTLAAFIYTCKAAIAAALTILLCEWFNLPWGVWAAVSALIVIQPSLHPSLRASLVRVAANLIAAGVGSALHAIINIPLVDLVLGILAVGMICHHTKLDDGLRAGYAAIAIVTLTLQDNTFQGAVGRVVAVVIGCVCAVLVNVLFDKFGSNKTRGIASAGKSGAQHAE